VTVDLVPYQIQGPRVLGMVDHFGHRFQFRSKYVDKMPDDVVQDLIAHELTHGLQSALGIHCIRKYADGRADFAYRDGTYFGGKLEIEEDDDFRMELWGFDPWSIDRWMLAAGISKVIDVDDPKKRMAVLRRIMNHGR
jgi:hypothetical protein